MLNRVLFEEYVARMLKRALQGTALTVHAQGGRRYCLQEIDNSAERFMTKPDILIKRGSAVEMIIDTKWKRLSRRIDDPKQGVSQSDVYQMMVYSRLYGCAELMLLYPHHAALTCAEGVLNRLRIQGSDDHLSTATVDVSTGQNLPERLRALAPGET